MKYLIVGRVGYGQEKLADELKKVGLSVFCGNNENGKMDFSDAVMLDLSRLQETADGLPRSIFHVVQIEASVNLRVENAISSGMSKRAFNRTDSDEDGVFKNFETRGLSGSFFKYNNVTSIHRLSADVCCYNQIADFLAQYMRKYRNCAYIVSRCIKGGIIQSHAPGTAVITRKICDKTIESDVSIDAFADAALSSPDSFNALMDAYLSNFEVKEEKEGKREYHRKKLSGDVGQISMVIQDNGLVFIS